MHKNSNPKVVSLVASLEGLKKALLTAAMHCDDVANGVQVILASRQRLIPAPKTAIAMATPTLAAPVAPVARETAKPAKVWQSTFKLSTLKSVAGITPEVGKVFTWVGKKGKSTWKVDAITGLVAVATRQA